MTHPLSDSDLFNHPVARQYPFKIVTYPELSSARTIDDVFGKHTAVILLYNVLARNNGHWTLLLKHLPTCPRCTQSGSNKGPNGVKCNYGVVEYFDPYGTRIDDVLTTQSREKRLGLGQLTAKLSHLLAASRYCIVRNDRPVQKRCNSIVTCGHHCLARLRYRHSDVDDYVAYLKSLGPDMDQTVVDMYHQLI